MFANVLNIYTEYILTSRNTKLRFNMTMLVVKIKNSHIQIILEEKLKIIVLAPFTEMIYKISDMWFRWVNKYTAHIGANDLLDSFYSYRIFSKNISNFNKLNSLLTLNWIKVISCISYVEEVTGIFFPLKYKLWIHFLSWIDYVCNERLWTEFRKHLKRKLIFRHYLSQKNEILCYTIKWKYNYWALICEVLSFILLSLILTT